MWSWDNGEKRTKKGCCAPWLLQASMLNEWMNEGFISNNVRALCAVFIYKCLCVYRQKCSITWNRAIFFANLTVTVSATGWTHDLQPCESKLSDILNTLNFSVYQFSKPFIIRSVLRGWWSEGVTVCDLSSFIFTPTLGSLEQRQETEASMFSAVCRFFILAPTPWEDVKLFFCCVSVRLTVLWVQSGLYHKPSKRNVKPYCWWWWRQEDPKIKTTGHFQTVLQRTQDQFALGEKFALVWTGDRLCIWNLV